MGRDHTQKGFTIVELLVAISVLAILASIVAFSFGSWRARVAADEAQSDLNNVKTAMENVRNFQSGYPSTLPTGFTASSNTQVTYYSGDATNYCVDAKSVQVPSVVYYIKTTNGEAGKPTAGTCATS